MTSHTDLFSSLLSGRSNIRVEGAIAQLQSLGQPITRRAIGKIVGVHVSVLLTYPRVNALLKQVTSIYHEDRKRSEQAILSEDELVAKVEKAVEQLERLGKSVTQRSEGALKRYPRVKMIWIRLYMSAEEREKDRRNWK